MAVISGDGALGGTCRAGRSRARARADGDARDLVGGVAADADARGLHQSWQHGQQQHWNTATHGLGFSG